MSVLKDKSDVYNFTSPSVATKRRAKTRSKSSNDDENGSIGNLSTKPKTKSISKNGESKKCDAIREIQLLSKTINESSPFDETQTNALIILINEHINSKCLCVDSPPIRLLLGNAHFEAFILKYRKHEESCINEEDKSLPINKNDDASSSTNGINDIPVQSENRFENDPFSLINNLPNLLKMIEPLKSALREWRHSIRDNKTLNCITEETVIRLKVLERIAAACNAFSLFRMPKYQLESALLMVNVCRLISTEHTELRQSAIYYAAKSYLNLGAVSEAKRYLEKANVHKMFTSNSLPNTFGSSLLFLVKCECDLMNDEPQKSAQMLKTFLDSEYFQKYTTNRYYVKGLALFLASHYSSNVFPFSPNFIEFIESVQISYCILRRWYPFLSRTTNSNALNAKENIANANKLATIDPLWYQFAVHDFAAKALTLACHFYSSIGMTPDVYAYYNLMFKVLRRTCSVISIAKILTIGAQIDYLCAHYDSAIVKLINAERTLLLQMDYGIQTEIIEDSVFEANFTNDKYTIDDDDDDDDDEDIVKLHRRYRDELSMAQEHGPYSPSDGCGHESNKYFTIIRLRNKLMKRGISNPDNSPDDSIPMIFNCEKLSKIPQFSHSIKEIPELFIIKLEINLKKVIYKSANDDCETLIVKKNYLSDVSLQLKKYHNDHLIPALRAILTHKSNAQISDSDLQNYGPVNSLTIEFHNYKIKFNILRNVLIAIDAFSDDILSLPVYYYNDRCHIEELRYLQVLLKYKITFPEDSDSRNSIWFQCERNLNSNQMPDNAENTPSPQHKATRKVIPGAPKAKNPFQTDEMRDYFNALKNAIYNDHIRELETTLKKANPKVSKDNPKVVNKLDFDSDSMARSLSISEDVPESAITKRKFKRINPIIAQTELPNVMSTRITRSKSSLMKENQITDNGDTSKLTALSTRSRTMDSTKESCDDCFDDVVDELGDVFENLGFGEDNQEEDDTKWMITQLKSILKEFGSHPPVLLYKSIHYLLAQIYSHRKLSHGIDNIADLCGYYLSESITAATFRYRCILIGERKKRGNRIYRYADYINRFMFNHCESQSNRDSIDHYMSRVPRNWRIVQITCIDNGTQIPDILFCRYQKGQNPVFLKIKGNSDRFIQHFMTQFTDIIKRSNDSIHDRDRETFWRLRYALDNELYVLLEGVEQAWLGMFKGILLGEVMNRNLFNISLRLLSELFDMSIKHNIECINYDVLNVVTETFPLLKDYEFLDAITRLFPGAPKTTIMQLYEKYIKLYPMKEFTSATFGPVGLILDKSLEMFPYESLPFLKICSQSMFRVPSLRMLNVMVNKFNINNGIDEESLYYVLNPADNLPKTEEFFSNAVKPVKQWSGAIGKAPNPNELKQSLEEKDIYMFFGHGAGSTYYRSIPDGIDSVNINTASLVIGCSSGRLFAEGPSLESWGSSLRFMMNGAPCYVGVLWDVTDKDIDRFSDEMLKNWMSLWPIIDHETNQVTRDTGNRRTTDIINAVCKSRDFCKLKHLIGAAPVVYGLPFRVKPPIIELS